jgi:hypothetical protein
MSYCFWQAIPADVASPRDGRNAPYDIDPAISACAPHQLARVLDYRVTQAEIDTQCSRLALQPVVRDEPYFTVPAAK